MILDELVVISSRKIEKDVFQTVFAVPDGVDDIRAGQFVNVYPKNQRLSLPRPISVCGFEDNELKIVYKVVGDGTRELSGYEAGDVVKLMYPLGNGFNTEVCGDSAVLVGGGIGAPPLLFLAKKLKEAGVKKVSAFLGFESGAILLSEFKAVCDAVFVASMDGSCGKKGTVIDLLNAHSAVEGYYFSCGPKGMLRAICAHLGKIEADGQISLEERMACGFGACVGCAVKIKGENGDWSYKKACKDGPVFNYREVLWD